jgi:hypothetical protein
MQQQLPLLLPEAAQHGRITQLGAASEQLKGSLGALLQLCAALQFYCTAYVLAAQDTVTGLATLSAGSAVTIDPDLFAALGAACTAVDAALKQQQQQQQQLHVSQPDAKACSKRCSSTYAEEAAQVLLHLVQWLCYNWTATSHDCTPPPTLPHVQPAEALAATVLRICGARLQGRQPTDFPAAFESKAQLAAGRNRRHIRKQQQQC